MVTRPHFCASSHNVNRMCTGQTVNVCKQTGHVHGKVATYKGIYSLCLSFFPTPSCAVDISHVNSFPNRWRACPLESSSLRHAVVAHHLTALYQPLCIVDVHKGDNRLGPDEHQNPSHTPQPSPMSASKEATMDSDMVTEVISEWISYVTDFITQP